MVPSSHRCLRLLLSVSDWLLQVFDSLYDQFPRYSDSFFEALLGLRKALRMAMTNKYYGSLMLARYCPRYAGVCGRI